MPVWVTGVVALAGVLLTVVSVVATRYDAHRTARRNVEADAMKFGEHWRDEANALLQENERMRLRITEVEQHCIEELTAVNKRCAEELHSLGELNKVLERKIVELIASAGGMP